MAEQTERKLNRLERNLPEGLLVDAAWLSTQGYSTSLRSQYVSAGWLEQPCRGVYRRTRGVPSWQQTTISLQTLLERPLVVGGRTALELQGYGHFLFHSTKEVHLYGPKRPPTWLTRLSVDATFVYHNNEPLLPLADFSHSLQPADAGKNALPVDLVAQPYGQWNWNLILSCPERALFELLDELPQRESFHQVDALMEGLANLRPSRLERLLAQCRSIKVKRLFFFFADRHRHAWLNRIDKKSTNLGKGKRMLVRGGTLDATYQITVPEDLNAVS